MKSIAVGYIRVSSEGQAESGLSLDGQREKIRQYCELKDLALLEIIADEGISAKNLKRPGIQRLLGMVKGREIQAVIVYKLDRIFRNTSDALDTARYLDTNGVALHSIEESLDTRSAMGEFFFTLMAALAQMERKLIGERTRFALAKKRQNGQKCGGHVPYGYTEEGGKLVENEAEQNTIEFIRQAYNNGWSLRGTCKELTKRKIPTRTGGSWTPETVRRILRRDGGR